MPKKKPNPRTAQIHVRLTIQEAEKILAAAKAERRTLSDYLVIAGLNYAKE